VCVFDYRKDTIVFISENLFRLLKNYSHQMRFMRTHREYQMTVPAAQFNWVVN